MMGFTMQDEQRPVQKNNEQVVSQRTQQLIESLDDLWQRSQEPFYEQLKRVTELVAHFPKPYQAAGMTIIAQHLVNNMSLHFLDIMETFLEKAEQEGIDQEEQEGTFHDVMSELLPIMMRLSGNITVQSLDDLVTLSNITFGLYRLSQADSAERAQRWMYKLPKLYCSQLAREHLVTSVQAQLMVTIHPVPIQPMTGQLQLTVTIQPTATQPEARQPQLTGTIGSKPARIIDSTISDSAPTLVA